MACAVSTDLSRTGHPVLDETWRHATAIAGLSASWSAFGDLATTASPRDWNAPTRCEGWAVRDVAAHVIGQAIDIASGRVPPGPPAEQAVAHRARTPRDMARVLADTAPPVLDLLRSARDAWDDPRRLVRERTIAESSVALWHDTVVHLDDILDALGQPPVPAHDLLPCVAHLSHTCGAALSGSPSTSRASASSAAASTLDRRPAQSATSCSSRPAARIRRRSAHRQRSTSMRDGSSLPRR